MHAWAVSFNACMRAHALVRLRVSHCLNLLTKIRVYLFVRPSLLSGRLSGQPQPRACTHRWTTCGTWALATTWSRSAPARPSASRVSEVFTGFDVWDRSFKGKAMHVTVLVRLQVATRPSSCTCSRRRAGRLPKYWRQVGGEYQEVTRAVRPFCATVAQPGVVLLMFCGMTSTSDVGLQLLDPCLACEQAIPRP